LMFGLNTDPTGDASYTSIDFAMYLTPSAEVQVYEGGAYRGTFGSYSAGSLCVVSYDGYKVRYVVDGVEIYSTVAAAGLKLYGDSSFASPGSALSNIRFGPLSRVEGLVAGQATPGAWTDMYLDTAFDTTVAVGGATTTLRTLNIAAPSVNSSMSLTLSLTATNVLSDSGNQCYWEVDNGVGVIALAIDSVSGSKQMFTVVGKVDLAAGTSATVKLKFFRASGNPAPVFTQQTTRVEVIKR
jgi:hypothetical protein